MEEKPCFGYVVVLEVEGKVVATFNSQGTLVEDLEKAKTFSEYSHATEWLPKTPQTVIDYLFGMDNIELIEEFLAKDLTGLFKVQALTLK